MSIITDTQLGRAPIFPLSSKVRLIDLNIDFGKEYGHSFCIRTIYYYKLMHIYHRKLKRLLINEHPDIVVTLLGREISILTRIKVGSIKVGEAHTTKNNIRNFHLLESKNLFFKYLTKYFRWRMDCQINKLNALVVLTNQQINDWPTNVPKFAIPNALPFYPESVTQNRRSLIIILRPYSRF